MKQRYLLTAGCCCLLSFTTGAQSAADYAIRLQAQVQTAPPKVTLHWEKTSGATSWTVSRKSKTAGSWSPLAGGITDTFYIDLAVTNDTAYEYQVVSRGAAIATGYIYAGINTPPIHHRGSLLLITDTLMRDSCAAGIRQLMDDLSGDGWTLAKEHVRRDLKDTSVKKLIRQHYDSHTDLKAVLLLGHVAVPYSGDINPDAHPDHLGAWPADVYYADMDGSWSDAGINSTTASRAENRNIPGDGKWDQSLIPSATELQVSRIDFADMPVSGRTEAELMNAYLSKSHRYKTDQLTISRKGLIDDNFGAFAGEAFAVNGWRNFSPLTGNILTGKLIAELKDSAYQWSYGCGGGSYTSCGGIGNSSDFTTGNYKGIFTVLFGSYFGDWDTRDNFLRAPLCSPEPALASFWAGRPNWFLHHMALGEQIGYSSFLSQNNNGLYTPTNYAAIWVHIALMGDLSLRTDYIKPPSALAFHPLTGGGVSLSWSPSPDPAVNGYYVYRADSLYGHYRLISPAITGSSWNDMAGTDGLHYYMVRPFKLQITPSGTYYNTGLGIYDSATVSYPTALPHNPPVPAQLLCFPNPADDIINLFCEVPHYTGPVSVSITDIQGRELLHTEKETNGAAFTISRHTGAWAPGIYLVRLAIPGQPPVTQRIVRR